ncbi:MAG: rRNA pseudouridine synthase [Oscillospiraceae bacterium]|nr:rRNA pseudouridine synthase [Oscillospiraceae bacterium]
MERLDRFLSAMGLASRKDAALLARRGEIWVNGAPCRDPAKKFPEGTEAEIRGVRTVLKTRFYYMMNKPAGYLSSTEKRGEATVIDLLSPQLQAQGLFPAGRLDRDSVGLLVLTNDGDFAHKVMSPRHKVDKVYEISYAGVLDIHAPERFRQGIEIDGGEVCESASLSLLGDNRALVTIHEGRYHQVKRMIAAVGGEVTFLRRISIGALRLDPALAEGEVRELSPEECLALLGEAMEGQ